MIRRSLLIALTAAAFGPGPAWAQLSVLGNFDKKLKPTPAQVVATFPSAKENTVTIDAATKYEFAWRGHTAGPSVEYHLKRGVEEPQHQLKIGGGATLEVGTGRGFLMLKATYGNDWEKGTSLGEVSATFTPVFSAVSEWWGLFVPNNKVDLGRLEFVYEPVLGFEHFSAGGGTDPLDNGVDTRVLGQISAHLFPFFSDERIDVELLASFRHDLKNGIRSEDHRFLRIGVDWVLLGDKDQGIAIGAGWVSGEDPSKGFKEQEFFTTAFKAKWTP